MTYFCYLFRAADRFCGAIISGNGTFADCLSHVDLQQFATDCTFDMCATNGDLETFSKVSPKNGLRIGSRLITMNINRH